MADNNNQIPQVVWLALAAFLASLTGTGVGSNLAPEVQGGNVTYEQLKRELDVRDRELKNKMPPPHTRQRITAMENHLSIQDGYTRPTYDW